MSRGLGCQPHVPIRAAPARHRAALRLHARRAVDVVGQQLPCSPRHRGFVSWHRHRLAELGRVETGAVVCLHGGSGLAPSFTFRQIQRKGPGRDAPSAPDGRRPAVLLRCGFRESQCTVAAPQPAPCAVRPSGFSFPRASAQAARDQRDAGTAAHVVCAAGLTKAMDAVSDRTAPLGRGRAMWKQRLSWKYSKRIGSPQSSSRSRFSSSARACPLPSSGITIKRRRRSNTPPCQPPACRSHPRGRGLGERRARREGPRFPPRSAGDG